jgi:hypothetical protein
MTSQLDLSTMISYWNLTLVLSLLSTVHKLYAFFPVVSSGALSISAARELPKPEAASPHDSSTTVSY